MIPLPGIRDKGSGPQLGARRAGETGPYGPWVPEGDDGDGLDDDDQDTDDERYGYT